jgi:hypothetical protein
MYWPNGRGKKHEGLFSEYLEVEERPMRGRQHTFALGKAAPDQRLCSHNVCLGRQHTFALGKAAPTSNGSTPDQRIADSDKK